MAAAAVSNK